MLSGSIITASEMLSKMGVTVLESIVVDEQCEFNGREKLADTITVTPLVRTTPVDDIPEQPSFACNV